MTIAELVSKADFWSALFGAVAGALSAFLLGAAGTWWAANSARRTAGNLTLVALSQMYSLMENLCQHFLVREPTRFAKLAGRPPVSFEIRAAVGMSGQQLWIPAKDLGFLAECHDPDILNRLLSVERAFGSMLDLIARHERLHNELQEQLAAVEKSGRREVSPQNFADLVGMHILLQLNDTVMGLAEGLPATRDSLQRICDQLQGILRIQFPIRHILRFDFAPRSRAIDQAPAADARSLWRRAVRGIVDLLLMPVGRLSGCHESAAEPAQYVLRSLSSNPGPH